MTEREPEAGYGDFDRERFLPEDRNGLSRRGEFARDRARVLHSSALRRLGAKTQVLSPANGDYARTRLTHSLEVAQIGREMAVDLGLDADLVDMACLAHDLGHPPFGHNGERALNDWSFEFGGFEGNAQTLRLLTRLEPKVLAADGRPLGLNLTRASLDATCKYPWLASAAVIDSGADRTAKFGVYDDDLVIFEWLRRGAPSQQKCVEAQVMDFADDVAYSVHDFEDAVVAGYVDLQVVADPAARKELLAKIAEWNGRLLTEAQLEEALENLMSLEFWPAAFDNSLAALGSLKNLSSALIGRFVGKTTDSTFEQSSGETLTRFGSAVTVPATVAAEISVLKGLVSAFLMSHESRRPFYEWQRAVLVELADALLASNGAQLDAIQSISWDAASDDSQKHRVIVDQIASLTDQSALNLHHKLVG
jgi:dGTPase